MSSLYASYSSPLGRLLLRADGEALTGLWFEDAKHCPRPLPDGGWGKCPALEETRQWLELYFTSREPGFMPPLRLSGTPFQLAVWELLRCIPYGTTVTYGALARQLGRMSAQAVGGAVGRNPISILVPCHRVVGSGGALTGYAGGLDKKSALLALEGTKRTAI